VLTDFAGALTGLMAVFIAVDLTLTDAGTLTIVTLTQHAATAASAAQQAAYLAAAHYGLATVPFANTYSWVISSVAFLLISMAMLKGVFSKRTAYVGIAAAIMGIAAGFYVFHPALATFRAPFRPPHRRLVSDGGTKAVPARQGTRRGRGSRSTDRLNRLERPIDS
jgi:hypothetical protein